MTEGEICRQYRSAKDRASQLQILADLNCAPRLEIIKILMHNGEQVRLPLAAKGKKRTTELTDKRTRIPKHPTPDALRDFKEVPYQLRYRRRTERNM